jgi:xanthine dehydrogenase accessory factor
MKIEILKEIIEKKSFKEEFAVLTNLSNGNSEIFNSGKQLDKDFENYKNEIENFYNLKKNGIIEGTQIFIFNYIRPIEVIIVGAVHIAQYLIDYLKNFNFVITIIDPRKYFTTEQRFQNVKIINDWPNNAFEKINTNTNIALITLTHDPKIDDQALNYALKNKFFYIGALGSIKTHIKRCQRLREVGFSEEEISSIYGPIGLKLGGKSTPEIALSIVAQLVSKTNDLLLNSKD